MSIHTPFFCLVAAGASALVGLALPGRAQAQLTPTEIVDAFEAANGKQASFRRSGAKGVCAVGEFVGNAEGRSLSAASAFSGRPVPVVLRFSVGGPNPKAPDNARGPRGLSLAFSLPGGETWQMANLSTPVFGAKSPEQLVGALLARAPDPATGKPDPVKVKAYTDANPEITLQGKYLASQPVPASYAQLNYWGVNAFAFVDAKGNKQFAKWVFEPAAGTAGLSDDEAKARPTEFLADELRQRVAGGPVAFNFVLQLAQPGDVVNSAVLPLPEDRKKVTVGQLLVKSVEAGSAGACANMTFNPVALPKGVEPSDDPILLSRAAPYAVSLSRRLVEGAAGAGK